jgi:hypothetical protein
MAHSAMAWVVPPQDCSEHLHIHGDTIIEWSPELPLIPQVSLRYTSIQT